MIRLTAFLYLGCAAAPLLAQNAAADTRVPAQAASTAPSKVLSPAPADPQTPIIGDAEFDAVIPSLDDAPVESIDAWQAEQEAREEGGTAQQQAAQTAAAKNRYQLALHKCSVMQRENWLALCTTTRKLSRPTCARQQIIGPPCALSLASYYLLGNGICCAFIEPCA